MVMIAERRPYHVPVLVEETLEILDLPSTGVVLDCTVGGGGHAAEILARQPGLTLVGLDRDSEAVAEAGRRLAPFAGRFTLAQARFSEARRVLDQLGIGLVERVLADLGISSHQVDTQSRGFSLHGGGSLDMRMTPGQGRTALDIVRETTDDELANIIYAFGEVRASRRVAAALKQAVSGGAEPTAAELATVVERCLPRGRAGRGRGRVHPATPVFQALRIAVNEELAELDALLSLLPSLLAPAGRAAFISFHSLEDGRVKRAFRAMAATAEHELLTRKPVRPGVEETASNPRSRSARLRGLRRCG